MFISKKVKEGPRRSKTGGQTGGKRAMAYGRYIVIKGPSPHGDFVATMPDGQTRLVLDREDLEALQEESGVQEVYGDVLEFAQHLRPAGVQPDLTAAR
jgi:hypothetical protein